MKTVLSLLPVLLLPFFAACRAQVPPPPATAAGESSSAPGDHPGADHDPGPPSVDAAVAAAAGVRLAVAGPGTIALYRDLPGEVRPNGDRLAHVAPRVGGIARRVSVRLGDRVRRGEILAVLESRELARARAALLAARARLNLARETFRREDRLRRQQVSAEQDWLNARTALARAEIAERAARQELLALGVPPDELDRLDDLRAADLARLELRAPLAGEVIQRHITPGEAIAALATVFTVADLSSTWVDLAVYPRDLALVTAGSPVVISAGNGRLRAAATIDYVAPLLGEETRTATARVVLPNPRGAWRPGTFVTGRVSLEETAVPVAIPLSALLRPAGDSVAVFVAQSAGRFILRRVVLGRTDDRHAEVVSGLEPGERYVAAGGFALLAELRKDSFDHDEH